MVRAAKVGAQGNLTPPIVSRVAVWQDGLPVIVADEEGNRALPSYVGFSSEGRKFGSIAKAQQGTNMENT